jgi:hypothetical protein
MITATRTLAAPRQRRAQRDSGACPQWTLFCALDKASKLRFRHGAKSTERAASHGVLP